MNINSDMLLITNQQPAHIEAHMKMGTQSSPWAKCQKHPKPLPAADSLSAQILALLNSHLQQTSN